MTKRFTVVLASFLYLFFGFPATSFAQDAPSLVGTWSSTHPAQSTAGFTVIEVEFEFEEQQGALFNGKYRWRLPPAQGVTMNDGAETGFMGEEDLIGVIDWDNRSVVIVDAADTGHFQGRLINNNTLEMIYFEAGENAAVARGVWVRQASLPE